jgi:broad specificity phosphatase PhoE
MPDDIVRRQGSPLSFVRDSPLTQVGRLQGTLVGKGLAEQKVLRDGFDVYVSPSLRCVETAVSLGKGTIIYYSDIFKFSDRFLVGCLP